MNNLEEVKALIQKDKRKLTVVFDIDSTLAEHSSLEEEEKLFVIRKSMIIIAMDREHQVLPGVIELMQVLFTKDYIQIAFFSSGVEERNSEFVRKLLTKSLGDIKYLEVESSVIVLSKADLTPSDEKKSQLRYERFGINWGETTKDITKALGASCSLTDAVFVDDDSTYIHYGQEKNFLKSPWGKSEYYAALKDLKAEETGYKRKLKERFIDFNTVFYVAGILSDCMNAFEKGDSVTDLLFNLHFKKASGSLFNYERNHEITENTAYHDKGLALLKTVNPQVCFVSPEDYVNTVTLPATDLEQQIIDECKSKKTSDECRIV